MKSSLAKLCLSHAPLVNLLSFYLILVYHPYQEYIFLYTSNLRNNRGYVLMFLYFKLYA